MQYSQTSKKKICRNKSSRRKIENYIKLFLFVILFYSKREFEQSFFFGYYSDSVFFFILKYTKSLVFAPVANKKPVSKRPFYFMDSLFLGFSYV